VGANKVVLQGDGNFVACRSDGRPVWASNTDGSGANLLVVQHDGNLVLQAPGRAVWATNTPGGGRVTAAGERAARWAEARVGATDPGAENPDDPARWSEYCLAFAVQAWRLGAGVGMPSYPTAIAHYGGVQSQVRGGVPPRGAIVFYDAGDAYGHAGVSVGGGDVVSTKGWWWEDLPVRRHRFDGLGIRYLGWYLPA
jgi:hypothetical protein